MIRAPSALEINTMASETVYVACKLPNGLVLRLFDMVPKEEHVMGGGLRKSAVAVEKGETRVTLKGFSHPQTKAPNCEIVEGFALTPDVNKDFFEAWMKANSGMDAVRNGLIFGHPEKASVVAYCMEYAKKRSGLERLNPESLPMRKIETAQRAPA